MNLPHVSTLEEAAIYLSEATGDSWTPKLVLDFAITKPEHSSRKPAPIAFAAMPIGTTFGRYEFTSPDGMVRNGSARWQLVPLYPIHAAQLVVAGNTFVGVVERPDDDDSDGVHYALIEPLDVDHEVTLDMVRMKRAAIESILNAYSATASSGAPESNERSGPIAGSEGLGITKAEILEAEWPLPNDAPRLENILDKIPKWVDEACIKVGRVGKGQSGSHLWNPAVLAVCLATRTSHKQWICNQAALTKLISGRFSDYLDEWKSKLEFL